MFYKILNCKIPRPPRLIVLSILVMACTLFFLSSPRKVAYTLHGAEVDLEGNVIESSTLAIEGRISHWPFQASSFQLTNLEFAGATVGTIYESAYPLYEMMPMPGNYHTFALIALPEYSYEKNTQVNIFFSEDHRIWIVTAAGHIFIGTTAHNPDYAQIMDLWGNCIDSFME